MSTANRVDVLVVDDEANIRDSTSVLLKSVSALLSTASTPFCNSQPQPRMSSSLISTCRKCQDLSSSLWYAVFS
jgi:hypothetical protein